MKVVFLDFDGVINSVHHEPKGDHVMGSKEWLAAQADPTLVRRVQRVCDETGAVICLITSWRHAHPHRALAEMLVWVGLSAPVIGQTPALARTPRDGEIAEWLRWTGVTEFVVLDDFEMYHPAVAPKSVLIEDGITEGDMYRAMEILGLASG